MAARKKPSAKRVAAKQGKDAPLALPDLLESLAKSLATERGRDGFSEALASTGAPPAKIALAVEVFEREMACNDAVTVALAAMRPLGLDAGPTSTAAENHTRDVLSAVALLLSSKSAEAPASLKTLASEARKALKKSGMGLHLLGVDTDDDAGQAMVRAVAECRHHMASELGGHMRDENWAELLAHNPWLALNARALAPCSLSEAIDITKANLPLLVDDDGGRTQGLRTEYDRCQAIAIKMLRAWGFEGDKPKNMVRAVNANRGTPSKRARKTK